MYESKLRCKMRVAKQLYKPFASPDTDDIEVCDVAVIGGGPAGSTCATLCAAAGLRTLVLEREKFPREKVCGDCINPACWPVLQRLGLVQRLRLLPHADLQSVEFIGISGHSVSVDLPSGEQNEIAIKRSLFDNLLLTRTRELGVEVRDNITVTGLKQSSSGDWSITAGEATFTARILIAADGRNSTVARLCNLLPRPRRERVALQAHIPLPPGFGNRVVLQFLKRGYSGQAPVNESELNVCLVANASEIEPLKDWAAKRFRVSRAHAWRTITPLTRAPLPPAHRNLFLIGDTARVVEPFTGEGIYYALRSGELAANAVIKIIRNSDRQTAVRQFQREYAAMYRGRLWVNRMARAAVLEPEIASRLVRLARFQPSVLRLLTSKIAGGGDWRPSASSAP
jgi:geranylgeranyl reductase family protein